VGSLKTIVESTLGTDLAKPAIDIDKSFIKPGKASWSWVLLKDDQTIYEVQKRFIDYAADMNWEYCLIDAGWNQLIGYERIQELVDYGKEKNVGILLWYNSAGDWNTSNQTPRDLMLTHESRQKEFGRIAEMGVKGVKVDFFGSDGMGMMEYYLDILRDAAAHKLLVNFHGSTLPRGWHRTYPHLMTMEAIIGLEFITFEQANADKEPVHATVIPFARNVFDPMDFTPLVLHEIPGIERKTSNGFQLALPVIYLSGIQHFGETPEGMSHVPEQVKDYLREVLVRWDEPRFLDGYPGESVIIARRAGEKWYVAGINGENKEKKINLDLSFIKQQKGELHTDGAAMFSFRSSEINLSGKPHHEISLKPNGGFVMVF
jgi:alpha-glucosidase